MPRAVLAAAAALLVLSGCGAPKPNPHYVLGPPYQAGGVWQYPHEAFDLDATGIAAIAKAPASGLTTDGEVFSADAMAAAHPTLQLPAIARITNLDTGRQVVVRVNDRGTGSPARVIEVTARVAHLLGFPADGVAPVRVQVLSDESQRAADAMGGAPKLAVATAPRGAIAVADLPPPAGASAEAPAPGANEAIPGVSPAATGQTADAVPLSLPARVTQVPVTPHRLIVRLDTFDEYQYAAVQRAKLAAAGARIVYLNDGRSQRYRVDVGPLASVAQADAVLRAAFAAGIPDARIVVD